MATGLQVSIGVGITGLQIRIKGGNDLGREGFWSGGTWAVAGLASSRASSFPLYFKAGSG